MNASEVLLGFLAFELLLLAYHLSGKHFTKTISPLLISDFHRSSSTTQSANDGLPAGLPAQSTSEILGGSDANNSKVDFLAGAR